MKKNKNKKIASSKEILTLGLVIFFSCLILSALAFWQISPYTYHQFDTTCQTFSYNDCMRWYYRNHDYFQNLSLIAVSAAILSLIGTLFLYFRKKKK